MTGDCVRAIDRERERVDVGEIVVGEPPLRRVQSSRAPPSCGGHDHRSSSRPQVPMQIPLFSLQVHVLEPSPVDCRAPVS